MLRKIALAALLAGSMTSAFAADQTVNFDGSLARFDSTGTVLDGGDDVITFANLAPGRYDYTLTLSGQKIRYLTALLNGAAADVTEIGTGRLVFAGLDGSAFAPFSLRLTGVTGWRAVYSGELSVSRADVPAPEGFGVLLAGLAGVLGLVKRRRGTPA